MKNLVIGIYGEEKGKQKGAYNLLSNFITGIYHGFKKINENTFYLNHSTINNYKPQITISLGCDYINDWNYHINQGAVHFIWSIDSLFRQAKLNEILKYFKNSIFIGGPKIETEPISYFYPHLNFHYIPIGTDENIWCPNEEEKTYDIVLMSSLADFEETLRINKENTPPALFNVYMELINLSITNPELNFWTLYKYYVEMCKFEKTDFNMYANFLSNVVYVTTHFRRVKMIKTLKDFNVKIWGSPLWEKFIEGKIEYMGKADFPECVDITRKAKMVLNLQTMQGQMSLSDRVVNTLATETFVLSDYNAEFIKCFRNNIGFFDNVSMEDLPDQVSYYLKNEEEREHKAKVGRELVLQNHTWENRARYILHNFFNIEV